MRFFGWILLFGCCAALTVADEVIDSLQIDGKTYQGVKWGPVNNGKVVIFYSQGVTMVPLDRLPPQYRARFGPVAETNASAAGSNALPLTDPTPDASTNASWQAYVRIRATKLLLDGKLVDRSELTELTGFLMPAQGAAAEDARFGRLWVLNLAEHRKNLPASAQGFDLRPGLWQATEETVVLINYEGSAEDGSLVRVYGSETDPMNGHRAFKIAKQPSYEEWQQLHGP